MMQEPNKEYWKAKEVTGYDRKQRLLVPRKDEILDTTVDFIIFDEKQPIHVLDLGAGQGALSERILLRFRQAHITLFDSSVEMLSVAEQKLSEHAPRVSIVSGDFNSTGWYEAVERPVDVVVSSLALHYLRTECRLPFFQSVFDILSTPGCFLIGDAFNTQDQFIQQRCNLRMLEYTRHELLATEGKEVTVEKLRENMRTESGKAGINRLLFAEQADLLKESGFSTVDMVWRYLSMAVIAAYKR